MNEVASLDLCKELYELSNWRDTRDVWHNVYSDKKYRANDYLKPEAAEKFTPAYSLGYLLRKLPKKYKHNGSDHFLQLHVGETDAHCTYEYNLFVALSGNADTPENATAKLAIELFKQGILTKGTI